MKLTNYYSNEPLEVKHTDITSIHQCKENNVVKYTIIVLKEQRKSYGPLSLIIKETIGEVIAKSIEERK